MKEWKGRPNKQGIFVSEIKLKTCDKNRESKIGKLIKLLGGTDNETVS